ncbi:pyridoxamine 5'-phosphate oxidase family protein [Paenibacillus apii]|uniref:pyridoxamine 5'-phosphate oxidase family protein n=1 Tax=Paenibacillus apii TaxID=1850370 RepID=UPI001438B1DB|nr:pyridoxamine 5'-phosphate oxidase family protein [Paenibacillus apii]NJJ41986.1 pyridoxamine 5'-phosphate oxidase family protein [Paenibacillus apii]
MSVEAKEQIVKYLNDTRFVVLATVNNDQSPVLRSLGSFAADGYTIYFSTQKDSKKVEQIKENPQIVLFFQHENQELPGFVNVSLHGTAEALAEPTEIDRATELLGSRNPRFKERAEKGLLQNTAFYKVDARELKVLDFSKGTGADATQVIAV